MLLPDESVAVATWVGVVVNMILLCAVIYQARMNNRQVKYAADQTKTLTDTLEHTRTAHHISERAYLGISEIRIDEMGDDENDRILRLIFKNGGRTPAWNFSALSIVSYVERGRTLILSIKNEDPGRALGVFLMSGETNSLGVVVPISEYSEKIATSEGEILICGEATYHDFQQNHQKFRFVYKIEVDSRACTELPDSYIDWKYVDDLDTDTDVTERSDA
jgi:hypothetical protein